MNEVNITDTGLSPWSFLAPMFSQYFPVDWKAQPVFLEEEISHAPSAGILL